MTPKNLFNIILKVFGLFFLKDIIHLISILPYFSNAGNYGEGQSSAWILPFIATLISIVLYGFISYQLLFNTNKIVDKLKLSHGFNQQEFSFNIQTSLILTISLIVIGGVILTNEIPNFCRIVFSYIQEKRFMPVVAKPNFSPIITSGVKILLGLLIIGERKRIVAFVEKREVEN